MIPAIELAKRLPPELQTLADLVMDLRWTWSHCGDELWCAIDPDAWERTHNPHLILGGVSNERLAALAGDAAFRDRLARLADSRRRYRERDTWWAAQKLAAPRGIAYFSMEFGLAEALPLYAGGLGVLAGDYLKAASDLGLPVVGIGLLYAQGYFRQRLDADGLQQAIYTYNEPSSLPIEPVLDASGAMLHVPLHLPGRTVRLRVWQAQVGRVPLYLLDSNDPWNSSADRGITNTLYGGNQEQRLVQEIALGIGGWRLVEALQLPVDVCHLNEGHAAFAAVERARSFQQQHGLHFTEALWATRAGNVFTTHTSVAAGFDRFPRELVIRYGRQYVADAGVDERMIVALGAEGDENSGAFNMAFLAARCCARINGVSRSHGDVSRRIFAPLFPRWPQAQVPIGHVTNGVHVPSWDSAGADSLWTDACGAERWLGDTGAHGSVVAGLTDEALWAMRGREREDLVHYARRRLRRQLGLRGLDADAIADADRVLDPNLLTLGFARRFAEYKRTNLLLRNRERLARLLLDPQRPVQLLIAGKAHPDDTRRRQDIRDWIEFAAQPQLRNRVVFLEDYDLGLAAELVQGVDVWLNTPRKPWEACGTSGMKVLVNGGLNLSVLDGWWAEAYSPEVGWAIEANPPTDATEAERLFQLLEQEVVPLFYQREGDGIPHRWIARVRASLSQLTARFSTNRMLREYIDGYYVPAAQALASRLADGAASARELAAWEDRLRAGWGRVRLGTPTATVLAESTVRLSVDVYLGELSPELVEVQLYADAGAERSAPFCATMNRVQAIPGTAQGYVYELLLPAGSSAHEFTPRIVPRKAGALLPQELALIRWP